MNCEACEGKGTRPRTEAEKSSIDKDLVWYLIFDKISAVGFSPMEKWPCEKCHGVGFIGSPDEPKKDKPKNKIGVRKKAPFLRVIK